MQLEASEDKQVSNNETINRLFIKGSLLSSVPIVKRFRAKKISDAHAVCHVTCR